jgi:hypothetical protein
VVIKLAPFSGFFIWAGKAEKVFHSNTIPPQFADHKRSSRHIEARTPDCR